MRERDAETGGAYQSCQYMVSCCITITYDFYGWLPSPFHVKQPSQTGSWRFT